MNKYIKRLFDIFFSIIGLVLTSPLMIIFVYLVWEKDKSNPFYIADRVGKDNKEFKLMKIRTMIVNADKNHVDSTSLNDKRITKVGAFLRKYKIDELPQLFNILKGEMSFVGPRPNIKRETDIYTEVECKLLKIKPGLTDFASIVFSDEANILKDKSNPNIAYNQLIRPGKSKLALFYLFKNSLFIDVFLILITIISLISRKFSLKLIVLLLSKLNAPKELINIAARKKPLVPSPPPGSNIIINSRQN